MTRAVPAFPCTKKRAVRHVHPRRSAQAPNSLSRGARLNPIQRSVASAPYTRYSACITYIGVRSRQYFYYQTLLLLPHTRTQKGSSIHSLQHHAAVRPCPWQASPQRDTLSCLIDTVHQTGDSNKGPRIPLPGIH